MPEMSALLPRLTNVDSPICRDAARFKHRESEPAALRRERDSAGWRHALGERGVQPDRGVGVDDPHAVRPHHAHAVAAHALDELCLQLAAARIGLGESRGNDDDALHAGGGAVVDGGQSTDSRGTAITARSTPAGRSRADG